MRRPLSVRQRSRTVKYPCPCCGYLMFDEPPGSYDICKICFWEDDISQLRFPRTTGANHVSLIDGQKNFREFGACERRVLQFVRAVSPADFVMSIGGSLMLATFSRSQCRALITVPPTRKTPHGFIIGDGEHMTTLPNMRIGCNRLQCRFKVFPVPPAAFSQAAEWSLR